MLHVWLASGERLASLPVEEWKDVRTLKKHLQGSCKVPRFRQRILCDGAALDEDFRFSSPLDLQLVLLSFLPASKIQIDELSAASEDGEASAVERILRRPQDPDLVNLNSMYELYDTPLVAAAGNGHAQVVRLLLEAMADKDKKGNYDETPLTAATRQGCEEVARLLLDSGADINAAGSGAPLSASASVGNVHIVRMLLEARADVESANKHEHCAFYYAPLVAASRGGYTDIVHLLLRSRARINAECRFSGMTPAFAAARHGHALVMHLLLRSRADAAKSCPGVEISAATPQAVADRYGHVHIVRMLLEAGVDEQHSKKAPK